jgi:hypothetical protein
MSTPAASPTPTPAPGALADQPDVVATAAAVAEQIATEARAGGAFGPEVPAAAEAPALDRLLAFTGRWPVA